MKSLLVRRLIGFGLLLFAPLPAAAQHEPIDIGLREETEVRRLFIDVEAVDGKGRPMPGLTAADFKLRLDYLWRTIRSVDDLCPCSVESSSDLAASEADAGTKLRLAEVDTRFVLYLDFAQLADAGRSQALALARRWVEEIMQPGDEAMVVVHAAGSGLRRLAPFTSDPERLLVAIDEAGRDAELHDPFAEQYADRVGLCSSGTLSCYWTGRKEYVQLRRSFWALLGFLTRMDTLGGRKAVLYFHDSATMFPGRMYSGPTAEDVPDLIDLVTEVAAAATSSRTEIHSLVMGDGRAWTVNFGANVADGSGGDYNRSGLELFDKLATAGRGCRCIYRLGVVPPTGKTRVYRVKVKADGRSLPSRYRIHYRSGADRWAASAMAVLNNPEDDWGLEVQAALIPLELAGERWRVRVEVGLDLTQFPEDRERLGREWEVGVLLAQRESREVREMLGYVRLEPGDAAAGALVVHEREFDGLPPGPYEVRAYVRERHADLLGGRRARLELPDAKHGGGVAGPSILRRAELTTVAELPLRADRERILPMQLVAREGGSSLGFITWICDDGSGVSPDRPERLVPRRIVGSGTTVHEFTSEIRRTRVGCTRVDDALAPSTLPPGSYEYRVGTGVDDGEAAVAFTID